MANYNISIDTSNFKPFTYELKIAPLLLYNKDYDAMQDRMDKLGEKYEDAIQRTGEADVDALIDAYLLDLQSLFNDFTKYGLTKPGIRSRFFQLKGEAASTLKPIIKAVLTRDEIRKQMLAIQANDPTAILAPEPTVGELLRGRKPDLGYRSGKQIQAEAAAVSLGVLNLNYSAPEKVGSIANQYFILKEGGANLQQIVNALMDGVPSLDIEKQSTAIKMASLLYNKYITLGDTPANRRKIWQNVVQGFIMGIQAPKYNTVSNQGYLNPLQQAQLEGTKLENYAKRKENDAKDKNDSWGGNSENKHWEPTFILGDETWTLRGGILVDSEGRAASAETIKNLAKSYPETIAKIYSTGNDSMDEAVNDLIKHYKDKDKDDDDNNKGSEGGEKEEQKVNTPPASTGNSKKELKVNTPPASQLNNTGKGNTGKPTATGNSSSRRTNKNNQRTTVAKPPLAKKLDSTSMPKPTVVVPGADAKSKVKDIGGNLDW